MSSDALRLRSHQFHEVFDAAPIGIFIVDADLRLRDMNALAVAALGPAPDLVGRDIRQVLNERWHEDLFDSIERIFRHTLTTGRTFHEPRLGGTLVATGAAEYYDWRISRIALPGGRYGIVCYFSEISGQVRAQRAVDESEERYRTLFDSIDEGFAILQVTFDERGTPVDHRFVEVNPAFEHHTRLSDVIGRGIREMVPGFEQFWIEHTARVARTGVPARILDYSEAMETWWDVYAFRIGPASECRVAVLFSDVTERKRAEEVLRERESLLRYHAHHDDLSGLPNRILFEDRLQRAIVAAARRDRLLAVLFVDLDGFKLVNDTLGHAAGDAVIREAAGRLEGVVREADTVARLHGDEFVVLLDDLSSTHDGDAIAHALLAALDRPIDVAGDRVTVSASVGIAVYPRDGRDPMALLRAADLAMYEAKLRGKGNACHYADVEGSSRRAV